MRRKRFRYLVHFSFIFNKNQYHATEIVSSHKPFLTESDIRFLEKEIGNHVCENGYKEAHSTIIHSYTRMI